MGRQEVIQHTKTQSHQQQAKSFASQSKLSFTDPLANETKKRIEAELKIAVLTAHCNIPLAFHDKLSPTLRNVFPDSKIACKYHSASTKATCMLNHAVSPLLI